MKAQSKRGVTAKQIALIHLAKTRLGMDDATYRALLQRVAGVSSSRELDAGGFEHLMREIERLGFKSSRSSAGYGKRLGMATEEQLRFIRSLWCQYAGRQDDEGLRRFIQKKFGVSHLRFLEVDVAGGVIFALKAMVVWRASHPRREPQQHQEADTSLQPDAPGS